jgi:hypothetical protein
MKLRSGGVLQNFAEECARQQTLGLMIGFEQVCVGLFGLGCYALGP